MIDRWECSLIRERGNKWLLVYGRRKTGKTWLLRRCSGWSLYATVTRDMECIVERREAGARLSTFRECMREVAAELRRGGARVIIDEFQRLPDRYWEVVASASWEAEAGLVLCGSSMGLARRVFDRRSPLLGLLEPLRVDLAAVEDTVASLASWGLKAVEAVTWAIVARDPWLLRHLEPRGEPWRALAAEAPRLIPSAQGLVGEVFEEEERQLTRLYDAVLRLLAKGYWRAADIAARLYDAGLSTSPSPGAATGVLAVLEELGLVEKLPLWRTRRSRRYYRHRSSLVSLLYAFADQSEELGLPPSPEQVRARYGVELAFNIGEMLAYAKSLARGYSIQRERDIDVVLLDRRGRALWGYEAKMGSIGSAEAEELAKWLHGLGIPHAGVVALMGVKGRSPRGLDEILDAASMLELAERLREKRRRETKKPRRSGEG